MGSIEYHLSELKIALDAADEKRVLPTLRETDRAILDIGCGIGQTFVALNCHDRMCVGLDVDEEAIRYALQHHGGNVQYLLADAAHIPLPSQTFDLVYSRVSLPYTNIPRVIREIKRVLKPGGRVWMTLHSKKMVSRHWMSAIRSWSFREIIHRSYVLINGYLLKYLGILIPYINGSYESWQDHRAMAARLERCGFDVQVSVFGRHTVIEGTRTLPGNPSATSPTTDGDQAQGPAPHTHRLRQSYRPTDTWRPTESTRPTRPPRS